MKKTINQEEAKELRLELVEVLRNNNFERAQEIINTGLDINEDENSNGAVIQNSHNILRSTLHYGHFEIAELLINNGADINAKDGCNSTVLQNNVLKWQTQSSRISYRERRKY